MTLDLTERDNVISFEFCENKNFIPGPAVLFILTRVVENGDRQDCLIKAEFNTAESIQTCIGKKFQDLNFKLLKAGIHQAKLKKNDSRYGVLLKAKKFVLLDADKKKFKWEDVEIEFGLEDDNEYLENYQSK